MDNTELHYVTFDPDEIWDEMMLSYVNAGGDILYPGDEKEMLLRSVLADIVQVFAGVDNALRMQTLRYATGDYLDILGELRNCERINATAATATVTITTNATGQSDTLAAGSAMTADGELFFLLVEDFEITGYAQSVTVEVVADRAGSKGNGLISGTQMQLQSTHPAINSIIVATDAVGGQEREDDETYRERIRQHGLTSVTTGPAIQYEAAAKAVSSVIVDAKAVNLGGGSVGIYLILSDDTGSAALIQSVLDALNAEEVRPLTDSISVQLAEEIDYMLDVYYTSDNTSSTRSAIAAAVDDYVAWQDEVIGRPFNPDRLMTAIYQAGATRVTWGENSSFDGSGVIEYTEIEPTKHCKGTITLTANA